MENYVKCEEKKKDYQTVILLSLVDAEEFGAAPPRNWASGGAKRYPRLLQGKNVGDENFIDAIAVLKKKDHRYSIVPFLGGRGGIRIPDPLNVNEVL